MQNFGQLPKISPKKKNAMNPFAKALAEQEKQAYGKNPDPNSNNPLGEALARTGASGLNQDLNSPETIAQTQEDLEKKQKKELLRKKLHDQVNPVDQIDVFNAREQRVKQEIEKVRRELKLLAQEIAKLHHEVDIVVTQEIVNPGQEGQYYLNFFAQLRKFIMMLRQKVHSARTWAKQMQAKKRKQQRGPSLEFKGSQKAETVHTILDNSELNNSYSGG